jgi:hypothetical protein
MSKKKFILFNISNVAIVTGDNPYKKKKDFLIEFWEKNEKEDYERYKNMTHFNKFTDQEIIEQISKKNNIKIDDKLSDCMKSKDTVDFGSIKKKIEEDIVKNTSISEPEKKEILKSISNVTNTNFGTKNETDVLKIYESLTNQMIVKDDIYRKKKIYESGTANIYIGGKIDGINNENGSIIEIKNRVSRLFYDLRNYEKVQLMCYIFLFGSLNGHLVEALKKSGKTDINIIDVSYDEDYMNYIIQNIIRFYDYFELFMKNDSLKIQLLQMKDSDLDISF